MWKTLSASVTGRGHRKCGVCCQDRAFALQRNGVTTLALADGAGSSPISQAGAECVTRTACEMLCANFDDIYTCTMPKEAKSSILESILSSLSGLSMKLGVEKSQLACTLMAVAVRSDDYLIFHVGDGVIGYRKNDKVKVASAPQNGEFANRTTFVTAPGAIRHALILRGRQPDIDGFILMTDGCEASLYHKRNHRIASAVNTFVRRSILLDTATSYSLLTDALESVIASHTTDDCSIAIMSRNLGGPDAWKKLTPKDKGALLAVGSGKRSRRRRLIQKYERGVSEYLTSPESPVAEADSLINLDERNGEIK